KDGNDTWEMDRFEREFGSQTRVCRGLCRKKRHWRSTHLGTPTLDEHACFGHLGFRGRAHQPDSGVIRETGSDSSSPAITKSAGRVASRYLSRESHQATRG